MIAFLFEILGLVNFLLANYYYYVDKISTDWAFYLLSAIVMYIASLKYDQEQK